MPLSYATLGQELCILHSYLQDSAFQAASKFSNSRSGEGFTWETQDLENLTHPDGSFDLGRDLLQGGFVIEKGQLSTTDAPGLGVTPTA